jgi:hypothetical protein
MGTGQLLMQLLQSTVTNSVKNINKIQADSQRFFDYSNRDEIGPQGAIEKAIAKKHASDPWFSLDEQTMAHEIAVMEGRAEKQWNPATQNYDIYIYKDQPPPGEGEMRFDAEQTKFIPYIYAEHNDEIANALAPIIQDNITKRLGELRLRGYAREAIQLGQLQAQNSSELAYPWNVYLTHWQLAELTTNGQPFVRLAEIYAFKIEPTPSNEQFSAIARARDVFAYYSQEDPTLVQYGGMNAQLFKLFLNDKTSFNQGPKREEQIFIANIFGE